MPFEVMCRGGPCDGQRVQFEDDFRRQLWDGRPIAVMVAARPRPPYVGNPHHATFKAAWYRWHEFHQFGQFAGGIFVPAEWTAEQALAAFTSLGE